MALTRLRINQVDTITNAGATTLADKDITAIAGLNDNATGFLKKTGKDQWTLAVNEVATLDIDGKLTSSQIPPVSSAAIKAAQVGTGAVIQTAYSPVAATTGTTTIALNNNSPSSSAGVQIWTDTFIPTTNSSKVLINGMFSYSTGTAGRQLIAFLFRGTTCIATTGAYSATTTAIVPVVFSVIDTPATTSAVTYSIRVGGFSAHTWRINQWAGTYFAGTTAASDIVIQELA